MWASIFGADEPEQEEDDKENSPVQIAEAQSNSLKPVPQKSHVDWNVVLDGKERSDYGPFAKGSLREQMYRKHVLGEEIEQPKPMLPDMPTPQGPATAKGPGKGKPREKAKARPKKPGKKRAKAASKDEEKTEEEEEVPKTKYERCLQEGMDHIDRVKRLYEDIKALETKPDKWVRFRAAQMWKDFDMILEDYQKTIAKHQQLVDIYEHIGEACDNVELELQRAEILPWHAGEQNSLEFDLLKEQIEEEEEMYTDEVRDLDWEWWGVDKYGNRAPVYAFLKDDPTKHKVLYFLKEENGKMEPYAISDASVSASDDRWDALKVGESEEDSVEHSREKVESIENVYKGPPWQREKEEGKEPKPEEKEEEQSSDDEKPKPFRHQFELPH